MSRFLTLLRLMTVEEWRLHSDLFGGRRFAGFPLVLFVLTAVASYALTVIGAPTATLTAGVVGLAFAFGLQTGTIGFVSRDSLSDLLGDVTLLLYATRTLPVSARRVVAAFLVKDVGYYALLFLLPVSVGALVGPAVAGDAVVGFVLTLWPTATLAFAAGLAVTLAASSVWVDSSRLVRVVGLVVAVGALAAAVLLRAGGATLDLQTLAPPYSPLILGGVTLATVVLFFVGVWRFEFTDAGRTASRHSGYRWLQRRLGGGPLASLVAKTVFDVHRSSGGVWKLALSSGVLLGAAVVVVRFVGTYVSLPLVPAVLFGAVLGATAFPTYSWLTQVDSPADYRLYPVAERSLYLAKAGAFALLETPVVLVYYLGLALFTDAGLADLALGGGVLVGSVLFLFGLTVYVTGFQPDEFLFDTVRFSAYSVVMLLGLLPLVVAGFVLPALPDVAALATLGYAVVIGGVGVVALERAASRAA